MTEKTMYELSGIPAHKNPTALPFLKKSTTVSTVCSEEQCLPRL